MYNHCSTRVLRLLRNVLDTNREGVGWGIASHDGDFLVIWVLNLGFWCIGETC